jgi:DNA-binding transcriptional ArsR family regulator
MQARKLDRTLSALADPTRRGVVELLSSRPRRAGELASTLKMSRPAMSRHLRILRTSGLIEEERDAEDARGRVFRLRGEPFSDLQGWLGEIEQFWTDQLTAFKSHVEAKGRRGGR